MGGVPGRLRPAGRVQGEGAPGRGRGKPAQVTGARGGDSVGRGPPYGGEDGAPQTVRNGDWVIGRKEMTRGMRGAPPIGRDGHTPTLHSGRKSYARGASFADRGENVEAPPPSPEPGGGKVLSGPGPCLPGGPARPLPAGGPGRCRPSPSPAPTLPPAGPRAPSPRASRRDPSPSPTHSPSRAAPPLPSDPASGHSSHTPPQVPHSPSHTHSATKAQERPTYYASLARYVLGARARAPPRLGARLAKGGRRGGGGERERRDQVGPRSRLGNEVPLLGPGPFCLNWRVRTGPLRIDFWDL